MIHCVLVSLGVDNTQADINNIIFTVNDTKLYIPVVTLKAKVSQWSSKLFSKRFEKSVYWNKSKTKSKNKNARNERRYFVK